MCSHQSHVHDRDHSISSTEPCPCSTHFGDLDEDAVVPNPCQSVCRLCPCNRDASHRHHPYQEPIPASNTHDPDADYRDDEWRQSFPPTHLRGGRGRRDRHSTPPVFPEPIRSPSPRSACEPTPHSPSLGPSRSLGSRSDSSENNFTYWETASLQDRLAALEDKQAGQKQALKATKKEVKKVKKEVKGRAAYVKDEHDEAEDEEVMTMLGYDDISMLEGYASASMLRTPPSRLRSLREHLESSLRSPYSHPFHLGSPGQSHRAPFAAPPSYYSPPSRISRPHSSPRYHRHSSHERRMLDTDSDRLRARQTHLFDSPHHAHAEDPNHVSALLSSRLDAERHLTEAVSNMVMADVGLMLAEMTLKEAEREEKDEMLGDRKGKGPRRY